LQVAFWQRPPSQWTPQPPQLSLSVLGLMHTRSPASEAASPEQSMNPPGQAHMPVLQTRPAAQALAQAPQFCGSDVVLMHWGGLPHAVVFCGHTHLPLAQMVPPVQRTPHAPQLFISVCVLTQAPVP